jgi:hypothetical protein
MLAGRLCLKREKFFLGGDGSRALLDKRGAVNGGARPGENFRRFHQNQTGYADGIAELFADLCRAAEGIFAKRGFDMEVIQMAAAAAQGDDIADSVSRAGHDRGKN